jgi:glucose/arabinose dehydrogenase
MAIGIWRRLGTAALLVCSWTGAWTGAWVGIWVGLSTAGSTAAWAQGLALDTVEVAGSLVRPVGIVSAGDGSGRLFLVQQTGQILIYDGVSVQATPFLDLSGEVACCGETGLLGLAFHPGYAAAGTFFVDYTRDEPGTGQLQTVVSRFHVSAGDPDRADAASEEILLTVDQPFANHNAGQLAFGPDGYLYVALGDGGSGGDPNENGQDPGTLLATILRLDVDSTPDPGLAYAIPAGNPFVGVSGARSEVWDYGLRNPFRFSFDRQTGDLWIADVGQGSWEEIDFEPSGGTGGQGGRNYGWDCREGLHAYSDPNGDHNTTCTGTGYTDPILEYGHTAGRCSVTGGFRYRGAAEPRLQGVYVYADYCTGEVFGTVPRCDGAWQSEILADLPFNVTSFGEDGAGELYLTELHGDGTATSKVHRLVLAAGSGGPGLQAAPATLSFGTVPVGDTVELPVTLTNANAGPEAAAVTSSALTGPPAVGLDPHGAAPPCSSLQPCLPPGASCAMTVRVHATATGDLASTIDFGGNFAPAQVFVAGQAVACPSTVNLTLSNQTISDTQGFRACDTITAGPSFTVAAGGDVTFQAGTRIVLASGFRVLSGGHFAAETF